MHSYPKRLIEVDLPIKRISAHARAEKDSRLAHIPRLHIYPAARPLAACRAVICAALWPDPSDLLCPESFKNTARELMVRWATNDLKKASEESAGRFIAVQKDPNLLNSNDELRLCLLDFIADFANWDNSTDASYLKTSRALTGAAHESLGGEAGTRPLVADPFAGGGAMPLEGLRIGADVFASDLNPVAIMIQKVVLQYIPRYGSKLADELLNWLEWVKDRARNKLCSVYPLDGNGAQPIAYLWARTVLSEAPGDAGELPIEVPLLTTMWLARQKNRKRAVRWVRDATGKVKTEKAVVRYADGNERQVRRPLLELFEPATDAEVERGTAARNSATCPVTGYTTQAKRVEQQLKARKGGAQDARLYCVVVDAAGASRDFRLPNTADLEALQRAEALLEQLEFRHEGGISLRPTESVPLMSGVFNAPIYGHNTWESLFTSRQLLAHASYSALAREYIGSLSDGDQDYRLAVAALLGLIIDRLTDLNAALCGWQLNTPNSAHVFTRWALPMIMDFAEINPLAAAGGSPESAVKRAVAYIRDVGSPFPGSAEVQMCSATKHPLPDDSVSLLATDPPYYNAIPYADLMDFFYVWLRRSIGDLFPAIFTDEKTPKEEEVCEMSGWDPIRYPHKDKSFFEREMTTALRRGREIVRPDGLGIVVFAHKSTSGWEAMLQALVDAGWVITASWPIDTEMESRSRARNSATLSSSVHLVCRPREKPDGSIRMEEIGDWRDVLRELPRRIHEWMPRLADEGVVGADAIFACLGPALEIFSRYSRVEKASGQTVTLNEYLEQVWAAVAKEALTMIFTGADTSGFEEDARLTAMWLWTVNAGNTDANNGQSADEEQVDEESEAGAKKTMTTGFILEYDAARKIAQGLGAHLEDLSSLVEVAGNKARLLPVGERARHLFGKDEGHVTATKKKKNIPQLDLFKVLEEVDGEETISGEAIVERHGKTVLDRIHQSMILFAAGRSEALKRFLVEEGVGRDQRFWSLAQALSALYPTQTSEKRWVDGVLARKKGLGF
jgi:putative DNA methylase